jgi:hypothetical protein
MRVWRGHSYTLGAVLVRAAMWPDVFDRLIDYRRFIRRQFGVLVRAELGESKAACR